MALSWKAPAATIGISAYLGKVALLCFTLGIALAQVVPPPHPPDAVEKKHETREGPESFEGDFVASNEFRAGSYIQPLWRGLEFEGHYFGGKTTDTGFTGAACRFHIGELKLTPGLGAFFGTNRFTTSPALSLRLDFEHGWLVAQGLVVRGFRETPVYSHEEGGGDHAPVSYVKPKISDGNHLSARWKRIEIGGTFEHIEFREGSEWKEGGRLAFRVLPRLSAIVYVLGPGKAEWRFGVLVHRERRE